MSDLTEVDKYMAQRYRDALGPEAIFMKVDYTLPAKTMVVSPDVFTKMKELSDLEQGKHLNVLESEDHV